MAWEGLAKDEMRLFEALFKGLSTRFGIRTIESPFENQELIFCSKVFVWDSMVSIKFPLKMIVGGYSLVLGGL